MPVLRLDVVPPFAPSCRIPHNIEGLGHRPAWQKRSCWKFLKFHHDVRIRSHLAWTCLKFRELDRSIYNLKQMFGALPVFVQILYWHGTSFNSARRNQPKLAIRPSYLSWWRKSHIKAAFFERYLVRHNQRRRGPGRRWGTYPREHNKSDRKNPLRVCSGLVQGTCLYSFHVLLYNDCGARLSLGTIHGHLTHFWLGQK